jgi:hypothetical protein
VNVRGRQAIDCDVHANVPAIQALVPYLDEYWQDMVEVRGIDGFESRSYPRDGRRRTCRRSGPRSSSAGRRRSRS